MLIRHVCQLVQRSLNVFNCVFTAQLPVVNLISNQLLMIIISSLSELLVAIVFQIIYAYNVFS
jgi:hypothetical protein